MLSSYAMVLWYNIVLKIGIIDMREKGEEKWKRYPWYRRHRGISRLAYEVTL